MLILRLFLACFIGIQLFGTLSHASFSCIDDTGKAVDSWVVLKAATSFTYYTYNADSSSFVKSPYEVSQTTNGCVMETVKQIYGSAASSAAIGVYNDEPPTGSTADSSSAHAKGMLVTDANSGFFLVHSMPKWPPAMKNGPGPFPDHDYGQSLMCITISAATADTISTHLIKANVFIYSQTITSSLAQQLPNFNAWLKGQQGTESASDESSTSEFQSLGGKTFTQFTKSGKCGKDLWDDLVAPYWKTPINVETWRNGVGGRMSSTCGGIPYPVYEIQGVKMSDGVSWDGTKDHSKWASGKSLKVSCVGGINRMCSQEIRGGNAFCSTDPNLWAAFNAVINGVEPCFAENPCAEAGHQCYWCTPSMLPARSVKVAPPTPAMSSPTPPLRGMTASPTAPPPTTTTAAVKPTKPTSASTKKTPTPPPNSGAYSYAEKRYYPSSSPPSCSGALNGYIQGYTSNACVPTNSTYSQRYTCKSDGSMQITTFTKSGSCTGSSSTSNSPASSCSMSQSFSSSRSMSCISTTSPFSQYSKGLLKTISSSKASCDLLADHWILIPYNVCINNSLNGGGSYMLTSCTSSKYTIKYYAGNACKGSLVNTTSKAVSACRLKSTFKLYEGEQCINV